MDRLKTGNFVVHINHGAADGEVMSSATGTRIAELD
jgi:hypothetical protein